MFNFLKKKVDNNGIYAPATGTFVSISDVPDEVFSQKMMGEGFAIVPTEGTVFSPVNGTIASIFPTKHAIGIKTDRGQDVIVHMGIETVDLNGEPFEVYIKEGSKVHPTTKLAHMDLKRIADEQRENHIIVVFPNLSLDNIELTEANQVVQGKQLGTLL